MHLQTPLAQQTRAQRAGEVLNSVLQRVRAPGAHAESGVYTDAKPVVIDTSIWKWCARLDDCRSTGFEVGKPNPQGYRASADSPTVATRQHDPGGSEHGEPRAG